MEDTMPRPPMPKARVRIPIELNVTEAEAEALRAAGEVASAVRSSGLGDALGKLFRAGAVALRERKRRNRSR